MCGLGQILEIGKFSSKFLCFGCICGHLDDETENGNPINVKSLGSKFHIGECCTGRTTYSSSEEENKTVVHCMKTSFKAYLFIISLILYFIIPAVIVMTLVDHAQ